MAVSFIAAGVLAANATTTTLAIIAPVCLPDDILIAAILSKDNQVVSVPAGWTKFGEVNNTANQRGTLAWKRAVAGDSAATFNFTKPTDNNLLFCGNISAWRGCIQGGSPIDAANPTPSLNAVGDQISYASYEPARITSHIIALGFYNDDQTTAGAITGTNPALVTRFDQETATGSDASIVGYSGDGDGSPTGARSHATTSATDAISIGAVFSLRAAVSLAQIRNAVDSRLAALANAIDNRQTAYLAANGRYWQGIRTPGALPLDGDQTPPELGNHPTDQDEDYTVFGLSLPAKIPASLEIFTHNGPLGQGYTSILSVTISGDIWQRAHGVGPHSFDFPWTKQGAGIP